MRAGNLIFQFSVSVLLLASCSNAPEKPCSLYYVAEKIEAGTPFQESSLSSQEGDEVRIPIDYISDIKKLKNKVAKTDLEPGMIVTESDWVDGEKSRIILFQAEPAQMLKLHAIAELKNEKDSELAKDLLLRSLDRR